jgi:hypothetical protein
MAHDSSCILQIDLLVHLLDVTGPALDQMIGILNTIRALKPIGITTVNGFTTVYTKPPGTTSIQPSSNILKQFGLPSLPSFPFGRKLFQLHRFGKDSSGRHDA